jgi:cell division protein FtsN|tara:strand:+ start:915 stop:1505 length:591 start_codon:yes stop_codon:yes gene_type:complete
VASHDYARRKPKQKRKPAVSRWVIIFTLIVSVAFLAGLFLLSQQPDDAKASTVVAEKIKPAAAIKATPKTTDGASDQTAVGAQKGSFDFYTLLPDSEVKPGQVEAYISTPKDPTKKTNVVLQVGSFRKLADANRLRAKLILINMTNVVAEKTVSSNGAIWFRVRVGPFSNRSTLNKAEDILAQQGIESIRINKTTN